MDDEALLLHQQAQVHLLEIDAYARRLARKQRNLPVYSLNAHLDKT